ncbi:MAG: TlpA disulfide reductase family protein, partial [Candidatus Atribacteria bacterium]|nr:TlpA disulfide reductase family protein [Candidatus Atribacteria bacterium]
MKKNLNRVLTIIVPVLLLVVLSTSIGAAERKAPSFQLNGLNGKTYTLDDFRGRPVVIAFFDTNCGFCKKELPLLDKLYKTYQKSTALQVMGIDILDNGEDVQRMTSQMELSCLILLDETGKTMSDYRVPGIPTTFFIDPQGNMADYIIGATTEKKIHEKLDRIFWYQGLRDVEIQNLLEVASQIDLLDFRASAQNPYADRNNVKY